MKLEVSGFSSTSSRLNFYFATTSYYIYCLRESCFWPESFVIKSLDSVDSLLSVSVGDSTSWAGDGFPCYSPPRIAWDRLNSVFSILLWNIAWSLKLLGMSSRLVVSDATRTLLRLSRYLNYSLNLRV